MKYSVDEIINNIVKLENIIDNTITYVDISLLPEDIKESDIVLLSSNGYIKDNNEKEERLRRIKEKMEKLKNIGNR